MSGERFGKLYVSEIAALENAKLSGRATRTYFALASFRKDRESVVWPSQTKLAEVLGLSDRREVNPSVRKLVETGLIEVVKQGTGHRSTHYRFPLVSRIHTTHDAASVADSHDTESGVCHESDPPCVMNLTPPGGVVSATEHTSEQTNEHTPREGCGETLCFDAASTFLGSAPDDRQREKLRPLIERFGDAEAADRFVQVCRDARRAGESISFDFVVYRAANLSAPSLQRIHSKAPKVCSVCGGIGRVQTGDGMEDCPFCSTPDDDGWDELWERDS